MLCIACKNKLSAERCKYIALKGLLFCGKHAKIKNQRTWVSFEKLQKCVTTIARIWKGYFVRNQLLLSGPGVLKRSIVHNQEDLVTLESTHKIHPFDYFAFEESNKIWCFELATIANIVLSKINPINPYTRVSLDIETRKRLRRLCTLKCRLKTDFLYTRKVSFLENLQNSWINICQILEENGFIQVPVEYFTSLSRHNLYVFLTLFFNDIKITKKIKYIVRIKKVIDKFSETTNLFQYSFYVARLLLSILNEPLHSYNICFIIMSALYRL